jgi:hypothetical protein
MRYFGHTNNPTGLRSVTSILRSKYRLRSVTRLGKLRPPCANHGSSRFQECWCYLRWPITRRVLSPSAKVYRCSWKGELGARLISECWYCTGDSGTRRGYLHNCICFTNTHHSISSQGKLVLARSRVVDFWSQVYKFIRVVPNNHISNRLPDKFPHKSKRQPQKVSLTKTLPSSIPWIATFTSYPHAVLCLRLIARPVAPKFKRNLSETSPRGELSSTRAFLSETKKVTHASFLRYVNVF